MECQRLRFGKSIGGTETDQMGNRHHLRPFHHGTQKRWFTSMNSSDGTLTRMKEVEKYGGTIEKAYLHEEATAAAGLFTQRSQKKEERNLQQ